MKITVGQIKQVIAEEFARINESSLDEATPFGGVARTQSGRGRRPASVRRSSADSYDPARDGMVPDQIGAELAPTALQDARSALQQAVQAMSRFNPKWHRWVCRTPQGQEMSDIVVELESGLQALTRELASVSEAKVMTADMLRAIVEAEASRTDEAGSFLGQFKLGGRGRQPRKTGGGSDWDDAQVAPAQDTRKVSPVVSKVRTMISDMVTLYDTFTPKMRRKMCLGRAGDELVMRLQTLDDMLGKI